MSLFRSVCGERGGFYRRLIVGLPLLSQGPEGSYHPRTDEMDPRFRVHMDQLRILRDEAVAIIDEVDLLVPRVQQEVERLR